MRIICSGGGTGGHIFPAVAVAQELKRRYPDAEFLFIGAKGKMEMTKVPKAGFPIRGLWISGIQRSLTFKNLLFPLKFIVSISTAYGILKKFKPDVVAGFGGYASGAALWVATKLGLPTLIMEQNSYPGLTNRMLNGRADTACLAYDESADYFDKCKVVITGNPIRSGVSIPADRQASIDSLGLDTDRQTILIVGGSLGARSINRGVAGSYNVLVDRDDVQVIWQCGSGYYEDYRDSDVAQLAHVHISAFIDDMSQAYGAADLVICRAGALTIAEVMHLGKAVLMVPSPNVAEDHQTKNAKTVVDQDAGVMIKDSEVDQLISTALQLLNNEAQLENMRQNIKLLASPNATNDIADEVVALINRT